MSKDTQRKHLEACIEISVDHIIKCSHCGEVVSMEFEEIDTAGFLDQVMEDKSIVYVSSDEWAFEGPVCDDCFNDKENDFIKVAKGEK